MTYSTPRPGLLFVALLALGSSLMAAACSDRGGNTPVAAPGEPLPELEEEHLARFREGRAWFDRGWTQEEGLGPLYLQDRCSSCHDLPELGGTGVEVLTLATGFHGSEGCDLLEDEGGPILQRQSTPLAQAAGIFREEVPAGATHWVQEVSPLLYGLGLVEAIPEESILANADPEDMDGDGISGRASRTEDGRLGRLTRKAEVATIRELVEAAFATELGLTSPNQMEEQTLNGVPMPPETDPVPEPEIQDEVVARVTDFIRFLAPPAPEEPATEAVRDSILQGRVLFHDSGCASCHVPALRTGPSEITALDAKTIYLYSDMLLHDLGPGYQTVCALDASPSEFRTARLQGIRYRQVFSRGLVAPQRLEQAILNHGGEATAAREAFAALNTGGQRLLVRFLLSL